MGLRFRKSVGLGKGLRLNLGRRGASVSLRAGPLTLNSRGRVTARIPGTGLSYSASTGPGRPTTRRRVGATAQSDPAAIGRREAANADFLEQIIDRPTIAVQQYFFSHGVCVAPGDLDVAQSMAEHQPIFSSLQNQFDRIAEAQNLLADVGSLSLPSKEKAMLAVYDVESRLREFAGVNNQLGQAIDELREASLSMPAGSPLPAVVACAAMSAACFWLDFPVPAVLLLAVTLANLVRYALFRRRRAAAVNAVRAANDRVTAAVKTEVTPRQYLL